MFGWAPDARCKLTFQFPTAFVCAVVGIVDSIVAARENGSKYGYAVSPNRELVALGEHQLILTFMLYRQGSRRSRMRADR